MHCRRIARALSEPDEGSTLRDPSEKVVETDGDLDIVRNGQHTLGLAAFRRPQQPAGQKPTEKISVGESFFVHELAA